MCSCGRSVRGTPPPVEGAGWSSDEDEVREKLLAAADACYAAMGPVRTRMSDIARRAGVHRSTVFYYFAKKDTLLAASFVRVLAATAEAVDQCWQTDDPRSDSASRCMSAGHRHRTLDRPDQLQPHC